MKCPEFTNFVDFGIHVDEIIVIAVLLDYHIHCYKNNFNYSYSGFNTSCVLSLTRYNINSTVRVVYRKNEMKFVEIINMNENMVSNKVGEIEEALQRLKELL